MTLYGLFELILYVWSNADISTPRVCEVLVTRIMTLVLDTLWQLSIIDLARKSPP